MEHIAEFFLWYVAFLFSTVLHEAAHAFAAYRLGDRTRQYFEFAQNRAIGFMGLLIAWNIFEYIYDPVHLMVVNLLFYPYASYQ